MTSSTDKKCKWKGVFLTTLKEAKKKCFLLVSQGIDLASRRNLRSQFVFGTLELVTSWLSMRCPILCTRWTASAGEIDTWLYLKP